MRRIRAGALRMPVYLGRPVIAQAADGGEILTWEEFKTFALIEGMTGREQATGVVKDWTEVRISIRYSDGWEPSPRWRIRDPLSGDIYNLISIVPSGKDKSAECTAKRVTGGSDGR